MVLVLAGIVAAACHFGFITVDANKNIQINVSGVDSLIRSSVEKLENKTVIEDTATVITEHIDSTAQ